MRKSTLVADAAIVACLRASYGVAVAELTFLPLGYDADAWVYQAVADDGRAYFVKVRRGAVYAPSVAVPRALRAAGLAEVVAPLPTIDGSPWGEAEGCATLLYDFLEGENGWETGFTLPQWTERGAFLARLHASALPDEIARTVPRETFAPDQRRSDVVRGLLAREYDDLDEPIARELAALVRERREEIGQVLRRAEELGRMLQARHGAFVLCHADSHAGNVMIDPAGGLHIVDWDQPIYAPRERDLMFALTTALAGCAAGSPEEEAFFAGYGPARPDPVALAYYRYEWAVQDIGEFASSIVVRTHTGEEERRDSLRMLKVQFEPGEIIDAAYRSEEALRAR